MNSINYRPSLLSRGESKLDRALPISLLAVVCLTVWLLMFPQVAMAADQPTPGALAANQLVAALSPGAFLPTDVLQPGYAIYTSQAYEPSSVTLMVRDLRVMGQRYADPANLAGSAVDNSPFAPVKRTWLAAEFGNNPVMGVAVDKRTNEIYVGTSFLYNIGPIQPPFLNPIVAQVYRISRDGNTVELFATLPGNKGTGWLDIDTVHDQLYVSNLDDGLIYAIPLAGGVGQSGPFATFAPHPADALNESDPAVQPDWNMAPLGERVLGVAFNAVDARLYYSIWANDLHNTGLPNDPGYATTTLFNTVRSVPIAADGSFVPGSDRLEATLPKMGVGFSMPVSDITFNSAGSRMLLAEQGFDSINGWGAFAHTARVLEYAGSTGAWVAEPLNKFAVGLCCGGPHNGSGTDSRGGVAFAPGGYSSAGYTVGSEDFVIATADSVADDYTIPDHHFYVDGAGFMPASGSFSPLAVAGLDLDGKRLFATKGAYGDIDVLDNPAPPEPYDLALINVVNTTLAPGPFATGDTVTFTLTIYNQGTQAVSNIQIIDSFPAGLTLNDATWSLVGAGQATLVTPIPSLAPGASTTLTIGFAINAASGPLTQYAEISLFADSNGAPATDADSNALLGAGNDPDQVDNYIYGTLPGEDHDDLDPASIDLGTVGIGNLVFVDANGNRRFDAGEGQAGVTVQLFRPGYGPDGIAITADDHDPITSTVTTGGGEYAFTGLRPGGYVVTIPYTMFAAGAPLEGYGTIFGSGGDDGIDDNGDENGLDPNSTTVPALSVVGSSSQVINLVPGNEPTAEGGFNGASDSPDADIDYTVDFGFFQGVGIGNLVWLDFDGNGQFTPGEGAGGIPLELYRPGVGPDGIAGGSDQAAVVATTTTANNGHYAFTALEPGTYLVKIPAAVFQLGQSILNGSRSLPGNGADNGQDDDVDENGIDTRTPEIDGVSSGLIVLAPGAEPTDSETGDEGQADVPDAQIDYTVDFGFSPLLALGNEVWIDGNGNQVYDAGEGVDGVTVELLDIDYGPDGILHNGDENSPLQTFTTFNDGLYFFLAYTGNFVVQIPASQFQPGGPLAGYVSLPGGGGDNQIDDNGDENGRDDANPALNGIASTPIALAVGSEPINEAGRPFYTSVGPFDPHIDFTVDFAFVLAASLGDRVWLDLNKDGVQDSGEAGVAGVSVALYDSNNNLVRSTTTGNDGLYRFDDLAPGSYSVQFDLPAGYGRSPQDAGDDAADSDANPATGQTALTTLTAGENDVTWDAGIYFTGSLGDRVWLDRNANGVQDAGEPGLPGVAVSLFTATDQAVGSAVLTDQNGNYTFNDLPPGDYYVRFAPPTGYFISPPDAGGDDSADSDVNAATQQTVITTLVANGHDPTWDLGLYQLVSLGNLVWDDANNNGVVDAGEPGIANVTVRLYTAAGVQLGNALQTDAAGHYLFPNLLPGDYYVEIDLPGGYASSSGALADTGPYEPAPDADDDRNNDDNGTLVGGSTVVRSSVVTLHSAAEPINDEDSDANSNLTVDFGLYKLVIVGDYVWIDQNGNGSQEAGEPGVPNVKVTLLNGVTGQPVVLNNQPVQTTTAGTGHYLLAGLPPGVYAVRFDLTTLPAGYVVTPPNLGSDDAQDSDADSNGRTPATGFLPSGSQNLTLDLGIYQPVTVGDYVWIDSNDNGRQDAGETGVANVLVTLLDSTTGQPVLVNGRPLQTTTDASGHYLFSNLPPGNYAVLFDLATLPVGYVPVVANLGGDDAKDSDAASNGQTPATGLLLSGSQNLTLDLGIQQPPNLALTKRTASAIVAPGSIVTYTLTYTNQGVTLARKVLLTETVPANTTYVASQSSPGWQCSNSGAAGAKCTFALGDLAPGQPGTVLFALKLSEQVAVLTAIPNVAVIGTTTLEVRYEDNQDQADVHIALPNAVQLAEFYVLAQPSNIRLRWQTAVELNTLGYRLLRSADGQRSHAQLITASLIGSQGRQGGDYSFTDSNVQPAVTYTYWLVEIDVAGNTHEYGPVQGGYYGNSIFLALLRR